MIKKLDNSHDNIIGYAAIGSITKDDYHVMVPEVEALAKEYGTIHMLIDMSQFKWEKISAWGADLRFGREFRKNIGKLAIVGDKRWEKWLAKLASPFYAHESKFFHTDEMGAAWQWLDDESNN